MANPTLPLYGAHGTAMYSGNYATITARQSLIDSQARTFFTAFKATLGSGGGTGQFTNKAVIDYTAELQSGIKGDTVTITQLANLQGIMTSGAVTGTEEKPRVGNLSIVIGRRRHAVGTERYLLDKYPTNLAGQIRNDLYPLFIARHGDWRRFRTLISGLTPVYHTTFASDTSLGAAAIASGGMTGADVVKLYKAMRGRLAKPISLAADSSTGQDFPSYACVMDPDESASLRGAADWKSSQFIGQSPLPQNPFNSACLGKYNNMYLFELDNDIRDGGSPLLAKCRLRATLATGSGVSLLHISTSGSAAAPARYFDVSGRIIIYNAGTTKKEVTPVVSHTNYIIRVDRTGANRTSWATGAIVARVAAKTLAFGAQVLAQVQMPSPEWIQQIEDYGEIEGTGIRLIEGYTRIDDVDNRTPGVQVLHNSTDRTYSPWN